MFCGNIINFLEEWNERNLRRVGREDSGVQPFGLGRFGTNLDRRRVTHNTWTHPFRAGYVLLVSVSRCDFCYQDLSDLDVCVFAVNIHREFSIDVHMGVKGPFPGAANAAPKWFGAPPRGGPRRVCPPAVHRLSAGPCGVAAAWLPLRRAVGPKS
jgi:hypothetical protein